MTQKDNKVVWVTGASSGIGEELCYKFSNENWKVVLTARRKEKLIKISNLIGQNSIVSHADISKKTEVEKAFNYFFKLTNKIDLAILNAGIYRSVSSKDFNSDDFKEHMDINYMGVVNSLEQVIPKMISQNYGHIAIVTSPTGWKGLPRAAAYGPTKSALKNLAETLRIELEPYGIKVQLLCPAFIKTESTPVGEHSLPGIITAKKAADLIYSSLKSNYFEVFIPNNLLIWSLYLLKYLPENLAHKLIKWKTGY